MLTVKEAYEKLCTTVSESDIDWGVMELEDVFVFHISSTEEDEDIDPIFINYTTVNKVTGEIGRINGLDYLTKYDPLTSKHTELTTLKGVLK